MRAYDLIKLKRDGNKLTRDQIEFIVKGFVSGTVPDYQIAAFLMAVYFKGMDKEETFHLTDSMCRSGDTVNLDGIAGFTIDKHSTGGVGDKTSLVLGPLLASLGLKVAKMSGRGLGHTGGTIDKLEAISGFTCDLSRQKFIDTVNQTGVAITGQTGNLVPADKKMYALRDVTATVDSIPLIAASIMSKKLAVFNHGLVLDVKVGSGAFMKNLEDATSLACAMVEIGKQAGRRVRAVLSNMDEPLGEMIGNALEVKEAIATLHGKGPQDFTRLVKVLAVNSLILSENCGKDEAAAESIVDDALKSGRAWDTFVEMVRAQGGDVAMVEDPDLLPRADQVEQLVSPTEGFISSIDCEGVGITAMMLGAGRETKDSKIDMGVGIELIKHVGDFVKAGETLARLHIRTGRNNSPAFDKLLNCFSFSRKKVEAKPLILSIES